MLRDSHSYEVQIIDAVRSVNKALGGTYGTSPSIYKSEYNQYEVQLIDAIRGIGRTLSGSGLSLAGVGAGEVTAEQFNDLARRVTKLENESFFRLVDGNVTLKEQYQNLWVPGWLAAGGVGTGGGGGGGSVDHLYDIGDVSINTATIADGQGIVWDATLGVWKNANVGGGGGGTGSVTSVALTVPTGLSVSGSPITSSGTLAIRFASGYSIPTNSKQSSWDAKQNAISDLATIRAGAALGATAVQTETDPTVPAWAKASTPSLFIGTTQVQTSASAQDLTGILSVKATSSVTSKFEWDDDNDAWHFIGNLYADGWVSAGGVGSGSGGGGGSSTLAGLLDVTLSQMSAGDVLSYNSTYGRWENVRKATYLSGYATESWVTGKGYITSAGLAGYATQSWVQSQGYLTQHQSLANYVTLDGTQTITGSKTFTPAITANGGIVTAGDIYPSSDGGASLGYGSRRFSNGNIQTVGTSTLYLKNSSNGNSGMFSASGGWMAIRVGSDVNTVGSYKQLNFHTTYGFYPNDSGVNLGYTGSSNRWATIYGVNADLTGNLSMVASSVVTIGPVTITYDAVNKALHVSGTDGGDTIGLYCDGFVAAGGIQQNNS